MQGTRPDTECQYRECFHCFLSKWTTYATKHFLHDCDSIWHIFGRSFLLACYQCCTVPLKVPSNRVPKNEKQENVGGLNIELIEFHLKQIMNFWRVICATHFHAPTNSSDASGRTGVKIFKPSFKIPLF